MHDRRKLGELSREQVEFLGDLMRGPKGSPQKATGWYIMDTPRGKEALLSFDMPVSEAAFYDSNGRSSPALLAHFYYQWKNGPDSGLGHYAGPDGKLLVVVDAKWVSLFKIQESLIVRRQR